MQCNVTDLITLCVWLDFCVQILRQLVGSALAMASADGLTSIAFPAIGTGRLQFPHGAAARAMFDEVKAYSAANQRTSISNVLFVIYNTDTDTLRVSGKFFYFCFDFFYVYCVAMLIGHQATH